MGFAPKGVWIMGYCGCMGYGTHFSANQLGRPKKVWGIKEYGFLELWVTRESTVVTNSQLRNRPYEKIRPCIFFFDTQAPLVAGSLLTLNAILPA
jgi:hypothetical protein